MLPAHLKRYVVEQDYSRYTPIDQAVWRYIMRQLTAFLSEHAHPCYIEGLKKTAIEIDRIPEISKMSESLSKFGWRAVPVSGFIPPAAFMEIQAHGYLPVASDLRTIDHLMYTPAPDIVHEAAGHAPILIDPEFASYLKAYAQVASKAIISHEDLAQYEAIRVLSDVKEDPHSTPELIASAERRLEEVSRAITHVSEAALLGRMNWWTAEYGLIGTPENPKLFGAGLLSSLGEAKDCLKPKVKKIPLTIDCIDFTYDITEPQPQLFVTSDFKNLRDVLDQLSQRMAFRLGGLEGLERARKAATVNTVQLDSGLQISSRLKKVIVADGAPAYLQFDEPTQLCLRHKELAQQGTAQHREGFGSPVGDLRGEKSLVKMTDEELGSAGVRLGQHAALEFMSGIKVEGKVQGLTRDPESGHILILSFIDCTVTYDKEVLFDPAWGVYDMAVGSKVVSVFGGPADRSAYGETDDFAAKVIPRKEWSPLMQYKHEIYQAVRNVREGLESGKLKSDLATSDQVDALLEKLEADFPHDWLLRLEILELSKLLPSSNWKPRVVLQLQNLGDDDPIVKARIEDGFRVLQ